MIDAKYLNKEITLNGCIDRIRYEDDNICIASFRTDNDDVIGLKTGVFLQTGQKLTVTGIVKDGNFGPQMDTDNVIIDINDTSWITGFMVETLKGVGPKTATKIYNKFHENTFDIIRDEPERLAEAGIRKDVIQKIQNALKKYDEEAKGDISYFDYVLLQQLIGGVGTLKFIRKIYEQYGKKAYETLKTNPYILINDLQGVGFKKADKVASGIGVLLDSAYRIKAAVTFVLESATHEGHCYYPRSVTCIKTAELLSAMDDDNLKDVPYINKLKKYLDGKQITSVESGTEIIDEYLGDHKEVEASQKTLDIIPQLISQILCRNRYIQLINENIDEMIRGRELVYEEKYDALYAPVMYRAEQGTAELIIKKTQEKPAVELSLEAVTEYVKEHTNGVADEIQTTAVYTSVNSMISVITGGPGTGKTTTLKYILGLIGKKNVIMLAPTGKAAQRMKEQNGCEAFTIHKLVYALKLAAEDPEMTSKIVDAYNDSTCIIADEQSMIPMLLAYDLLKLVGDRQLILVGDIDQLPPVGAGLFFKHLIESGVVPVTRLIHVYRNSGLIAENAQLINRKEKLYKLQQNNSFVIYNKVDDSSIQKYIAWLYKYLLETVNPKTGEKFRPRDIGVLLPLKERGKASCKDINELLRNMLNPGTEKDKKHKFRKNDRVIITRNNYKIVTYRNKEQIPAVFNGECGEITNIRKRIVRNTKFFKDNEKTKEEYVYKITLDDDRTFEVSESDSFMTNIELSYAITVHKSQGSEYPIVINACTPSCYVLLNKELLYTAVTRAKQAVYLLGTDQMFDIAVSKVNNERRNTLFKERLTQVI